MLSLQRPPSDLPQLAATPSRITAGVVLHSIPTFSDIIATFTPLNQSTFFTSELIPTLVF